MLKTPFVVCFLLAAAAVAQEIQTSITGTVKDPTGFLVPNAKITLTYLESGMTRDTTTNGLGEFSFVSVPPGRYSLRVEITGFKSMVREIEATTGALSRIDFVVPIGLEAEEIPETPPAPPPPPRLPTVGDVSNPDFTVIGVFYATDRKPSGSREPSLFFTGQRSPQTALSYGICEVSIPRDHRIGELEEPSIWSLDFRSDPKKHVLLVDIKELEEKKFYADLGETVKGSNRKEALVFIHGFRTSFEDAARRTAQIAYDLQFDGVPILYSWPSENRMLSYTVDEENANLSTGSLEAFLRRLAERSGAERIYLIAHSMGSRPLARALGGLAGTKDAETRKHFKEFILAAPDLDADEFRRLAAKFKDVTGRTTLYTSTKDAALKLSQKAHRYPRAGQAGEGLVIVPGVDTIDVSAVDTSLVGHAYYGENKSVITDLVRLIRLGASPKDRCGLVMRQSRGEAYWEFSKKQAARCELVR